MSKLSLLLSIKLPFLFIIRGHNCPFSYESYARPDCTINYVFLDGILKRNENKTKKKEKKLSSWNQFCIMSVERRSTMSVERSGGLL